MCSQRQMTEARKVGGVGVRVGGLGVRGMDGGFKRFDVLYS